MRREEGTLTSITPDGRQGDRHVAVHPSLILRGERPVDDLVDDVSCRRWRTEAAPS